MMPSFNVSVDLFAYFVLESFRYCFCLLFEMFVGSKFVSITLISSNSMQGIAALNSVNQ